MRNPSRNNFLYHRYADKLIGSKFVAQHAAGRCRRNI